MQDPLIPGIFKKLSHNLLSFNELGTFLVTMSYWTIIWMSNNPMGKRLWASFVAWLLQIIITQKKWSCLGKDLQILWCTSVEKTLVWTQHSAETWLIKPSRIEKSEQNTFYGNLCLVHRIIEYTMLKNNIT